MKYIPQFARGKNAFKVPFGYGLGYKDNFGSYYYIFPIYLLVRLFQNAKRSS